MTVEIAAAWAGAFAAFAAAMAAFLSIRFTRRAADAAQSQTELQAQVAANAQLPALWADIRPHPDHRQIICLFLGNSGPTVARNVHLTVDPPVVPGAQALSCAEAQQVAAAGIAALPPGRVMVWWLGVGHELLDAPGQPEDVTLSLEGIAGDGTVLTDEFTVRLSDFRLTSASAGNLEELVQEFKHFRSESRNDRRSLTQALNDLARRKNTDEST